MGLDIIIFQFERDWHLDGGLAVELSVDRDINGAENFASPTFKEALKVGSLGYWLILIFKLNFNECGLIWGYINGAFGNLVEVAPLFRLITLFSRTAIA